MRLSKVTAKNGQTWLTIRSNDGREYMVVHLDVQANSVEEGGTTIEVKTR